MKPSLIHIHIYYWYLFQPICLCHEFRISCIDECVPTKLKKAIMQARMDKKLTQAQLAQVTNDIFTKEDGELLVKHKALPEQRIRTVETRGCSHVTIQDDINNLAANFNRKLAYYIIYIIDVSGGDKISRKGGPRITQADLLVSDMHGC
ncbi:hypothetical protein AHAS_Ahas19G0278900 [Arachis hypogaea]